MSNEHTIEMRSTEGGNGSERKSSSSLAWFMTSFVSPSPDHFKEAALKRQLGRKKVAELGDAGVKKLLRSPQDTTDGKNLEEDCMQEWKEYCIPPPVFIVVISVVELILYLVYANMTGDPNNAPLKSPLIYNPHRRYEAWRYITYMFVHGSVAHIVPNLVIQLVLGIPLEMVNKGHRVGGVYLLGVLGGSMVTSVVDPKTYLYGASAGVYALIGAHLAYCIINWAEITKQWYHYNCCNYNDQENEKVRVVFSILRLFSIFALVLYAIVDTCFAVYERHTAPPGVPTRGYPAHLGGLVVGALMGVVLLENFKKLKWETWLMWTFLAIYLALVWFGIFWNACYPVPYYFPSDWTK